MKFKLSEFIQSSRVKPKNSVKITNTTTIQRIQQRLEMDFNLMINICNISRWLEVLNSLSVYILEFESSTDIRDQIKSFTIRIEYPIELNFGTIYRLLTDHVDERFECKVLDTNSVQYDMVSVNVKPSITNTLKHPLMNRDVVINEYGIYEDYYLMSISISKHDWLIDNPSNEVFLKSINISSCVPEITTVKEAINIITYNPNVAVDQSIFNMPNNQRINVHNYDRRQKIFISNVNNVTYRVSIESCPFLGKLFDTHLTPNSTEWIVKDNIKSNQLQVINTSFQIDKVTRAKMDKYSQSIKPK